MANTKALKAGPERKTRAKDLATFVEEELFDILSASVQSDVAAAFLKDEVWYVAVPVEPPSSTAYKPSCSDQG